MTTDLEKKFLETFGIEPRYDRMLCDNDYQCNGECNNCEYQENDNKHKFYPRITDTHYLQLLCLFTKEMNCFTVYDEDVESLKEAILKDFILDSGYFSKQEIKELFKE